jgi:hypothetical protein
VRQIISKTTFGRPAESLARTVSSASSPTTGVALYLTCRLGALKWRDNSDSVVVVDRWGNVAALVHSINTVLWGTTGIVVGGIPIADAAGFQQARLAAIKPGDPVPQVEAPVIAMTGSKPVLAIASCRRVARSRDGAARGGDPREPPRSAGRHGRPAPAYQLTARESRGEPFYQAGTCAGRGLRCGVPSTSPDFGGQYRAEVEAGGRHTQRNRCWERSIRRAMYGEVLRLPASTALSLPTDPIA